ncbi:MAG: cupin domain-containing protein [Acidimicrobiia bacterium]|nr:cupin domain-containing protein [Acidimicrobiia bacterium]
MSTEYATVRPEPSVLATNEGQHLHFLNHLATVKVSGQAAGSLSVVEFVGPKGFGPPLHRHDHEDELFIVLAGRILFRSEDIEIEAEEGAHAFLPHGRSHTFQVLSDTARFSCITASSTVTPEFDRMVTELGTPVTDPSLPAPGPIDPARVAEVNRKHGIEILGPPPQAL